MYVLYLFMCKNKTMPVYWPFVRGYLGEPVPER